jgi:hypothetical protein
MEDYKRLTFKRLVEPYDDDCEETENASNASYDELLNRLAELEDKIENGTLIEVELPCTEEELERELIDIEIQNMIRSLSVPGKYYSLREPRRKR